MEIFEAVFAENNAMVLAKIMAFINLNKRQYQDTPPCQFSTEQLKNIALKGISDAELGCGKSIETIRNQYVINERNNIARSRKAFA